MKRNIQRRRPNRSSGRAKSGGSNIFNDIAGVIKTIESLLPFAGGLLSNRPAVIRNGQLRIGNSAPVAKSVAAKTRMPKVGMSGQTQTISHKELLTTLKASDIIGDTADPLVLGTNLFKFPLQPGNPVTFPWLSQNAKNWSQYTFRSLAIRYKARCATSTSGSVIIAPDYTASDVAPLTEQQMTSYKNCVEDVPWKDIVVNCNVSDMHAMAQRKYIRTTAVSGDIKTFDAGNLFVCTIGQVAATLNEPIGKLWVEYTVDFHVPQVPGLVSTSSSSMSQFYSSQVTQFTTTVAKEITFQGNLTNGLDIGYNAEGTEFTPPAGTYFLSVDVEIGATVAPVDSYTLDLYKNGVDLAVPVHTDSVPFATQVIFNNSFQTIISADGTDYFSVVASLDFAAGVVATPLYACRLIFTTA